MAKSGTQMAPARGYRNLMTFDPWREMAELQRSINQLFNNGRTAGDARIHGQPVHRESRNATTSRR